MCATSHLSGEWNISIFFLNFQLENWHSEAVTLQFNFIYLLEFIFIAFGVHQPKHHNAHWGNLRGPWQRCHGNLPPGSPQNPPASWRIPLGLGQRVVGASWWGGWEGSPPPETPRCFSDLAATGHLAQGQHTHTLTHSHTHRHTDTLARYRHHHLKKRGKNPSIFFSFSFCVGRKFKISNHQKEEGWK